MSREAGRKRLNTALVKDMGYTTNSPEILKYPVRPVLRFHTILSRAPDTFAVAPLRNDLRQQSAQYNERKGTIRVFVE